MRKVENPEICRIGAPHRPPETYPPRPPRPPDSEKFESRGGLPPENRVRWVGGAHTRENGELAGETSKIESLKIRKIGKSVPPIASPVHTPRGPPGSKTGENCLIGYVVHRKTTSNLSWGYTTAKGPDVRTMSRSSKWSKSCGFKLVAFREQTGGQFCRFGGAPLRPPSSSPLGANRAKRFGRKLGTTVDLRIFGSVGLEGECPPQGHSCTIPRFEARWFWGRPPSDSPGRWPSCSDEHLRHGTLGAGVRSTPVSLA